MIERGEVLCLIGASGSGKSTLLQSSNGLAPIQGGQIVVTHDIALALESGDRVAILDRVSLCEVRPATQVICEPREERTRQFLQRVLN